MHLHLLEALPLRPQPPELGHLWSDLVVRADALSDTFDPARVGLAAADLDGSGEPGDDVEIGEGLQQARRL